MPYGDRTGPRGTGRMTGRAAGYCAGSGMPGFSNPVGARGLAGRGAWGGGGRGWRNWLHATGLPGWVRVGMGVPVRGVAPHASTAPVPPVAGGEAELTALKAQATYLEQALQSVRQRMQQLEGAAKSE